MKTPYSFSVLRYVHDPLTQEFVNIGVAVYSAEARFLRLVCTTHYARISRMFTKIDGTRFRQITRYVQDQVNTLGEKLLTASLFESGRKIEMLLAQVLPPDDSALQFAPAGVGLGANLEKVLAQLFELYVERYTAASDAPRREDEDIWRTFQDSLNRLQVPVRLEPKKIISPDYQYEFQHAWKNGKWHVYEPVSFDLKEGTSIVEKANRWLGRATTLADSGEDYQMHLLLGEPQDSHLQPDFDKARNILRKMPGGAQLIRESEADQFAEQLAEEVRQHHG